MLRDALLASLANRTGDLPLETLRMHAKSAGFTLNSETLELHLDYLVKAGYLELKRKEISAGVRRWMATAAGIAYCEREGLA